MKTRIKLSTIKNILIVFIICSYAGPSAGYNAMILICGILIFVFIKGNDVVLSKKSFYLWDILFIYLLFNGLLNFHSSWKYNIVFFLGLLILHTNKTFRDYNIICTALKYISLILAISILLQSISPLLFDRFARVWFFYSNQYETASQLALVAHQYSGLFYEVSVAAVILTVGYAIIFSEIIVNNRKVLLNVFLCLLIFAAIWLTQKRSFSLLVPTATVVFLFMYRDRNAKLVRSIALLIILISIIAMIKPILATIHELLFKGTDSLQLTSREKFWRISLQMFNKNPLIGTGINSFDIYFNNSHIRSQYYDFAGAHNSYIQYLGETGLTGITLLIISIGNLIGLFIKNYFYFQANNIRQDQYYNIVSGFILITLVGYAFTGNVFHMPQQVILFFWFSNIIYSLSRKISKKEEVR